MKLILIFGGLTLLSGATYWLCRCRHRWVIKHRPEREKQPLLMTWVCFDCGAKMGELDQTPKRPQVADLSTRRRELLKQAVNSDLRQKRA